jgi:hypothetical protein
MNNSRSRIIDRSLFFEGPSLHELNELNARVPSYIEQSACWFPVNSAMQAMLARQHDVALHHQTPIVRVVLASRTASVDGSLRPEKLQTLG